MEVKFLSTSEQATFNERLHEGELTKLFFLFMSELDTNSDHDTVMVSFDDEVLHARIEDTPYLLMFNEQDQQITLERFDDMTQDYVWEQDWDFDEDAVEEVVDYVSSLIYFGDHEEE